jgi:hypothetical protein
MVSQATKDILSAYNTYRSNNNQSTVKYTASNSTPTNSSKYDVDSARANLAQAESRVEIQNINEQMNQNQQDIEMVVSDYRSKNPRADQGTMNQDLRTKNAQYGGLLDDQQNLQEQKKTLEDKIIQQEYLANNTGDINKDADRNFNRGLITSTSVMDAERTATPVTYGTVAPEDRAPTGTLADQNFGRVDQGTIDSIFARQNQDRVDNAVQSNYFWQLRAGQVPVGKALYNPETKNTYFSGDTELPDMQNKAQRMELTRTYLEGAGQTMDTPIGNVKTSPTKYTEARNRATKSELLNLPMGDLNTFRPSLTKEGDYSGYIEPNEYRKQITTPQQSEFPSQQGDWNFYEAGFGRTYTMTEKVPDQVYPWETSQFLVPKDNFVTASTGVMSFENTKLDDSKVIMGSGNIPSMLGGINLFMFGGSPMKGLTKEATKVSDEVGLIFENNADKLKVPVVGGEFAPESETTSEALDWSGNKITEIPDDIWGQMAKGSQAEVFNIAQSIDGLATGDEKEYAPTVLGDTMDAFGYDTSENKYREYTNDFATNVGIFFESSATTLAGYGDTKVQEKVSANLIDVGEKFQQYPVYYLTTGAVEIGSMLVPVGKVGAGLKVGAQAVSATKQATKLKSLTPIRETLKTTDQRAIEIAQQFAGDATVKIVKKKGKSFIFIDKIVKDLDFMPKLTTKTKEIVKTKIRFTKKDGKGLLKTPKKEQRILSDQGATIEKLGGDRFLVNLGEGQTGKGFGYAIIDLKNSRTGVIMKEFNPLEKPPRWVKQATTADYPVEQLGNINWISNKVIKGKTWESDMVRRSLQKGRKDATGGEPLPKAQMDSLFDEGLVSQQPVYLFQGGKPFFPVNNPVTRNETVRDFFLTQMQKVGLKKNSKTLMQKDIGDDPDWVPKGYRLGGDTMYKDEIFKGYKVPSSKQTRWTEMIDTARKQSDEMDAFKNRKTTPYMSSFADEAGSTNKGSGGKGSGGNKKDGGDKSNKGNDGSSTKLVDKPFEDPSVPIGRAEVDAMTKATTASTPPPNIVSGLRLGSLFQMPMAFAQTSQQTKSTTVNQPAPRIGTSNLFRQQTTVQPPVSVQETKSIPTQQIMPKTQPMFDTRIKTNVIPQIKTDIMSMTGQTVSQIGAVSSQLDLAVRQDLIPKVVQLPKSKGGFPVIPKTTQMLAPKAITTNKKPTPARPIPTLWGAPVMPFIPLNLRSGSQKKKRKEKKKKVKGEATAWAVPEVWFDASGYYFSKGNAYVKGAKAKTPPKPRRVKKSKR